MDGKADTNAGANSHLTLIAWLAWLVVPLALAALLLAAKPISALGASLVPPALAAAQVEEEPEEAEFEEEELCDEAIYGPGAAEEGCEEPAEEKVPVGSAPPEECLLRSTSARAVGNPEQHRLKLTIGYTTFEPVTATIEIRKGSTRIGSVRRKLGRSGVLRIVKSTGKDRMARRVVIRIRIPDSPAYCGKFQTRSVAVAGPAR